MPSLHRESTDSRNNEKECFVCVSVVWVHVTHVYTDIVYTCSSQENYTYCITIHCKVESLCLSLQYYI